MARYRYGQMKLWPDMSWPDIVMARYSYGPMKLWPDMSWPDIVMAGSIRWQRAERRRRAMRQHCRRHRAARVVPGALGMVLAGPWP